MGHVAPKETADIISEPVALGSIQVPNDGNPIILLNDKQTVGGYTKIATVTLLDLKKRNLNLVKQSTLNGYQ